MNLIEKEMVDSLIKMKENYHVVSVKAEFEAEGTRMEEAMRLKEISMKAGVDMTIKVGGCEALKDMFEAGSLGTKRLVAPMVESAFAVRKYLSAVKMAFPDDLRREMEFYINIETELACKNFDKILALPEIGELAGIVIGRHDLTGSMDLPVDAVNSKEVLNLSLDVAQKAKKSNLKVVVGGAVAVSSLPFFKAFPKGHLDNFETRKIVFQCPGALDNNEEGFLKAVEFEIAWLKNKKVYYGSIHNEGEARLQTMEQRYRKSLEAMASSKKKNRK